MNKNKEEAIAKLIALIPEKERQFIKDNKNSKDPEIRSKINDIFIKYGVIEELFNPSEYFLSEENLLEFAKKGPEQKATAQFFLGRMIDNEGYWDVPDYRYPDLELDQQNKTSTHNDLFLLINSWNPKVGDEIYDIIYEGRNINNTTTIKINSSDNIVTFNKDNVDINISFDEIFGIFQKCRELGMKKPNDLFKYKQNKKTKA